MPAASRRTFLGAVASAPLALGASGAGVAQTPPGVLPPDPSSARGERSALILAGGANRGAYEAGVIAGLANGAGLTDGQPLGFEAICGTSIGAINGYFAATAQYTALRRVWREIADAKIFALKPRYDRIPEPSSGVLTRAYQGVTLGLGLTKNVTGVLDSDRIRNFLTRVIDPAAPVHVPLYASATNLTRERGETFVRRATTPRGRTIQEQNDALIRAYLQRDVRPATDDILVRVLLGGAALPILIDPVMIPQPDGSVGDAYVDGGVTDNVPVEIARRCAAKLHIVLVDPARVPPPGDLHSAVQIGFGVFQTMQQRMLAYQALLAIAETSLVPTPLTDAAGLVPLPVDPLLIRPATELPGALGDFDNLADLDGAWDRGFADGKAGWPPFDRASLAGSLSVF